MFTHQKLIFNGEAPNPVNPTENSMKAQLRVMREKECFSIINRGTLWYDTLSVSQLAELKNWYIAWLNVTDTFVIPEKLDWLNDTVQEEEEIW